jgi:hypothetical protein
VDTLKSYDVGLLNQADRFDTEHASKPYVGDRGTNRKFTWCFGERQHQKPSRMQDNQILISAYDEILKQRVLLQLPNDW